LFAEFHGSYLKKPELPLSNLALQIGKPSVRTLIFKHKKANLIQPEWHHSKEVSEENGSCDTTKSQANAFDCID
jgi:hypothetical protein